METFCRLKEVRAKCFCASLLGSKFTRHVRHRARALSSKVNNNTLVGQMAIAVTLHTCRFNGDPYFSFDGSFSLPIFYVLRKNQEKL